jgi:hypothetical protein
MMEQYSAIPSGYLGIANLVLGVRKTKPKYVAESTVVSNG